MGEKQLGWWYYMGVHIVWWVGHPSGRLPLPKAVSLSALPGPTAAHTHTHTKLALVIKRHTYKFIETQRAHTYRHGLNNRITS